MRQIEKFDLKDKIKAKELLQQYGMADFKNTVLRNFAKDYIEKQAALLSVTELSSIIQPVDSLNVIINASPAGGVKTQYPIEAGVGKQGQADAINIVGTNIGLRRANTTYKISHEVNAIGSAAITRNDLILEAAEQLGAKMDFDINLVRSLLTLFLFISFVTLFVLVFTRPKGAYDEAANLPFEEPNTHD